MDLLLFPMFHIGTFPIKISYILLAIWIVYSVFGVRRFDRQFVKLFGCFIVIIACGIFGELYMQFRFPGMAHSETVWSIVIYLLALFSFGFAGSNFKFNFKWLINVLFVAVFLNLLIIFASGVLPWINSFYYSTQSAKELGLSDLSEIADMLRPRGIFGNPNTSMLQVNVIFLFVILSVKLGLLAKPNVQTSVLIIVLPIILAIILGSRSELLVSLFYAGIFSTSIWGRKSVVYITGLGVFMMICLIWVSTLLETQTGFAKAETIKYAFERITKTNDELLSTEDENQGIRRPLILWENASSRFLQSPIFGSGFNAVDNSLAFPFEYSPRYYHNDWLRIIVTGGFVGLIMFIWVLYKYAYSLSFLLIVPFILPALTNTFILSIPSFMFYFFMLRILRKYSNKNQSININMQSRDGQFFL